MISELPISQIPPHLRHFPDAQAQMVLASIAESNTSGQLWSIPDQDGEQILRWDKGNNVFYFADLPTSAYANQELTELFQSRIRR